jgi:Family of unknown function (DUF6011)
MRDRITETQSRIATMSNETKTTAALKGFTAIPALMDRIHASGNDFPKVRLAMGDAPLVLTRAGARSRTPGAVMITDGGRYGESAYFGKITPQGEFQPAAAARALPAEHKVELWAILTRMRDGDAEAVFAEYGKRFGTCCMCGRELTNAESVELGIGPICRARGFA